MDENDEDALALGEKLGVADTLPAGARADDAGDEGLGGEFPRE